MFGQCILTFLLLSVGVVACFAPASVLRKDGTIWKRSLARMKELPEDPVESESESDDDGEAPAGRRQAKKKGKRQQLAPSLVGRWRSWAAQNPLLFFMYLLIFGHALYRISCILTNPIAETQ